MSARAGERPPVELIGAPWAKAPELAEEANNLVFRVAIPPDVLRALVLEAQGQALRRYRGPRDSRNAFRPVALA